MKDKELIMLVQGSNLPIIITFDDDPNTFQDISVAIYERTESSSNPILLWNKENVLIDEYDVICPIDQTDLMSPKLVIEEDLNVAIEIKWLGEDDTVYNNETVYDYISHRKDSTILGTSVVEET